MHDGPDQEYEEQSTGQLYHSHLPLDCAFCSGTGVHPGTMKDINHRPCPICQGKGHLDIHDRDNYKPCTLCGGSGKEPDIKLLKPCRACRGWGVIEDRDKVK